MKQICSGFMSSRFEPSDSLDDFPTPPWAGRALVEHVLRRYMSVTAPPPSLWEPAVNRGYLLCGLSSCFGDVRASDVFDYGIGATVADYLDTPGQGAVDFVITNPPFVLAHAFIAKALAEARVGCAFLVRTSFLEGVNRYESLFSRNPPTFVAQFAERVPMVKGRCDPEASTMTSYCWMGWIRGAKRQPLEWIPPCRQQLERAGDYDLKGLP
jgi:hypothetical protein